MNIVYDVTVGNLLVIFVLLMMVVPYHITFKRYVIGYRKLWRDRYQEKQNKIEDFTHKYRQREG